jgi:hypothetical protein
MTYVCQKPQNAGMRDKAFESTFATKSDMGFPLSLAHSPTRLTTLVSGHGSHLAVGVESVRGEVLV